MSSHPRPPRVAVAGLALLALLLGSTACQAGRPPAATVAGTTISTDVVDAIVAAYLEADPEAYGPQFEGDGDDTYRLDVASGLLGYLVQLQVQSELAQRMGAFPTEAELAEARELVRALFVPGAGPGTDGQFSDEQSDATERSAAVFEALPEDVQDRLVTLRADTLALARVAGEGAVDVLAQAEEIYESDPSAFEALCLRAIQVQADELDAVLARVEAGEDFGAVSAEVSVDPQLAAGNGEFPCLTDEQLQGGLAPEVFAALDGLELGQVSESVGLSDGTVVIFELQDVQVLPFEQVRDEIVAALPDPREAALGELVRERIDEVEVSIDPRFGTWDPTTASIAPPPGARAPAAEVVPIDPAALAAGE